MKYRFIEDEVINGERMKHVHLLDDKPLIGTTTCINEVYPPPLAWWGSAMAVEKLGFITAKKEPDELKRKALLEEGLANLDVILSADDRLDRYGTFLEECYKNHDAYKRAKGKAGKDIHALIENYIKYCLEKNEGKPTNDPSVIWDGIEPFVAWADKDVECFLWSEAHCYSEKLWVGGITDFGFVDKKGRVIIGDAKPDVYPKHFIQTAGYGLQIKENGLFEANGKVYGDAKSGDPIDGYMIFSYKTGKPWYLGAAWVEQLEKDFVHTVEMYKRKELIGSNTLE